ncbi:histone [Candidatus Bathyarchaeota archaeon]|nr:histone [Candidatus Bathyarchaeota archaeon]
MKTENDRIIPIAPIDRLIRKANADRVSESAAKELGVILEQLGKEIANRAIDLAKHAKRTTVKDSDIKLAYKQWRR